MQRHGARTGDEGHRTQATGNGKREAGSGTQKDDTLCKYHKDAEQLTGYAYLYTCHSDTCVYFISLLRLYS